MNRGGGRAHLPTKRVGKRICCERPITDSGVFDGYENRSRSLAETSVSVALVLTWMFVLSEFDSRSRDTVAVQRSGALPVRGIEPEIAKIEVPTFPGGKCNLSLQLRGRRESSGSGRFPSVGSSAEPVSPREAARSIRLVTKAKEGWFKGERSYVLLLLY